MVKRRKIVISSLAVAASLITYLAWRMNKRIDLMTQFKLKRLMDT